MQVPLPCERGASVIARAAEAGGSVSCTCGRSVAVPNLSRLRVLAGADAYTTNPVEAIHKALASGDDRAGRMCVQCGSTTPVFYRCTAICEKSHAKRTNEQAGVVSWILLPVFLNMMLWFHHKEEEIDRQGHDVEVPFDLPVCDACARPVGNVLRPAAARQIPASRPALPRIG